MVSPATTDTTTVVSRTDSATSASTPLAIWGLTASTSTSLWQAT